MFAFLQTLFSAAIIVGKSGKRAEYKVKSAVKVAVSFYLYRQFPILLFPIACADVRTCC
jgi:hypothetical protein